MFTVDTLCQHLGIEDPITHATCIGYGLEKPICDNRVSGKKWREPAKRMLQKICDVLNREGYTVEITSLLEKVAKLLHCTKNHQDQAPAKAQEWSTTLSEFRVAVNGAHLGDGTETNSRRFFHIVAPPITNATPANVPLSAAHYVARAVLAAGRNCAVIGCRRPNPLATPAPLSAATSHRTHRATPSHGNRNESRATVDVEMSTPASPSLSEISHVAVVSRTRPHPSAPRREVTRPIAPRLQTPLAPPLRSIPTSFLIGELHDRHQEYPHARCLLADFASVAGNIERQSRGPVPAVEEGREGTPSVYYDAVSQLSE
ncbi:hypothetical protein H2200_010004 [Cladophialophora chaetospira]|uniref:Uncharacterized protein n=1 Tax=Cladophialophora chaetospira TaxID=386627 RepID=A0AA39CEM3_9EURO|nr:hypothetical protein H2200_010004 [Cladophialophora chaetospira]